MVSPAVRGGREGEGTEGGREGRDLLERRERQESLATVLRG